MVKNTTEPAAGYLLLSEPFMLDPKFKRTVIIICEHTEDGSVGFILNRPMDIVVADAIINFESVQNNVFYGGPVATDTLHYLHTFGDLLEDSVHIVDDIYWGGNFEQLANLLKAGSINAAEIKFFLGYSGWSAGQLHDEIDESAWILTPAKTKYVFKNDDSELWKDILAEMGGDYKKIINYPEDPRLN